MSYIDQINRAVDYIEAALPGPCPAADICKEAGLSHWHFQRIFAATVCDTVAGYVSARRLSYAATRLAETEDKVIDIALDCHYASHEAFTRAFKRQFAVTPSRFRNSAANAAFVPQKPKITREYLDHLFEGITVEPEYTTLEPFTVVGVAGAFDPLGTKEAATNQHKIPELWQSFRSRASLLSGVDLGVRVGVIGGHPACEGKLDYLAGRKVEGQTQVPGGFDMRTVPGGKYAKFTHSGSMRTINHTMHYIFGSWLPNSGCRLAEGPEFGLYPDTYDPNTDVGEMYIFVPLA